MEISTNKPKTSTSLLKAQQLTEKLANLQTGLENEKNARSDAYQFKIKQLENRISKFKSEFDSIIAYNKDKIGELFEVTANAHTSLEQLD